MPMTNSEFIRTNPVFVSAADAIALTIDGPIVGLRLMAPSAWLPTNTISYTFRIEPAMARELAADLLMMANLAEPA